MIVVNIHRIILVEVLIHICCFLSGIKLFPKLFIFVEWKHFLRRCMTTSVWKLTIFCFIEICCRPYIALQGRISWLLHLYGVGNLQVAAYIYHCVLVFRVSWSHLDICWITVVFVVDPVVTWATLPIGTTLVLLSLVKILEIVVIFAVMIILLVTSRAIMMGSLIVVIVLRWMLVELIGTILVSTDLVEIVWLV